MPGRYSKKYWLRKVVVKDCDYLKNPTDSFRKKIANNETNPRYVSRGITPPKKKWNTIGTHDSFIFKGYNCYNPYIGGLKTFIFHGFFSGPRAVYVQLKPTRFQRWPPVLPLYWRIGWWCHSVIALPVPGWVGRLGWSWQRVCEDSVS